MITSSLISSCVWSLADIIAQYLDRIIKYKDVAAPQSTPSKTKHASLPNAHHAYQPIRTLRLTLYAFCIWSPLCMIWYQLLASVIPDPTLTGALTRMALDQSIFSFFLVIVFITYTGLTSGDTFTQLQSRWTKQILPVYRASLLYWIPMSLLVNGIIPPEYKLLFINAANLPYSVYLSYRQSQNIPVQLQLQVKAGGDKGIKNGIKSVELVAVKRSASSNGVDKLEKKPTTRQQIKAARLGSSHGVDEEA